MHMTALHGKAQPAGRDCVLFVCGWAACPACLAAKEFVTLVWLHGRCTGMLLAASLLLCSVPCEACPGSHAVRKRLSERDVK
jgi:hypothetical protein